jgi:hypothetical protein
MWSIHDGMLLDLRVRRITKQEKPKKCNARRPTTFLGCIDYVSMVKQTFPTGRRSERLLKRICARDILEISFNCLLFNLAPPNIILNLPRHASSHSSSPSRPNHQPHPGTGCVPAHFSIEVNVTGNSSNTALMSM